MSKIRVNAASQDMKILHTITKQEVCKRTSAYAMQNIIC